MQIASVLAPVDVVVLVVLDVVVLLCSALEIVPKASEIEFPVLESSSEVSSESPSLAPRAFLALLKALLNISTRRASEPATMALAAIILDNIVKFLGFVGLESHECVRV